MPAKSEAQQQFMGAELARKRAGKKTKTNMTEKQLEEFAATKHEGLPEKKRPRPKGRRGRNRNKVKHMKTTVNKRRF